jgi:uncharacterized protein YciI
VVDEDTEARLTELRAQMIEEHLWLVIARSTGADPGARLLEHLEFLNDLRRRNVLFASGPISTSHGEAAFGGATVIRAASAEEAHRIIAEEPYIRAGARTYELIAWTVRQGDFAIG